MKTILNYPGNKTRELNKILKYIPKFKGRYIEPFVGAGALYFNLEYKNSIINDLNSNLIEFYRGLKNNFNDFIHEIKSIDDVFQKNLDNYKMFKKNGITYENENEKFYYDMRSQFNRDVEPKYSKSTIFYFLNKISYRGCIRYNKKGKFNVPFQNYRSLNVSNININYSNLLKTTEIYNEDYKVIFDMSNKDDFMFLDPPYDCKFYSYGNKIEDFSNEDFHIRLAQDFKNLKCKALMVISKTPLIESLYKDYIVDEYDIRYNIVIKKGVIVNTKHLVIANYKIKRN